MKGKIVLITGSSTGIGKQTAIELAGRGATVLLHTRTADEGLTLLGHLHKNMPAASFDLFVADFEKQQEVQKMALEIIASYRRLDVLINNAALYQQKKKFSGDTIEKTFAVNHLAPFLLTHLLLRLLKNAPRPRIINVSSQAHFQARFDIDNLQGEKSYDGVNIYCISKLCNLLFSYQLAAKLSRHSVTVNAVHPGRVATDLYLKLFTEWGNETPQDAAGTVVFMAISPEIELVTGEYFVNTLPIQSSYDSYTIKYQKQLWKLSERLTGIQSSDYIADEGKNYEEKNSWLALLMKFLKLPVKLQRQKNNPGYYIH